MSGNGGAATLYELEDNSREGKEPGKDDADNVVISNEKFNELLEISMAARLFGGAIHDINNFVTVLESAVIMLEREISDRDDDESLKEILDILNASSKGIWSTCRSLMSMVSKKRSSLCSPYLVISEVLGKVKILCKNQVAMEILCRGDIPLVRGEMHQILNVIVNLVINAKEAGASKVKIVVERCREKIEGEENICISVIDNGSGMSDEVVKRVFEPFFTNGKDSNNFGIGLNTCYRVVRELGGEICVESKEGEGTKFFIYLPVFKAKTSGIFPK